MKTKFIGGSKDGQTINVPQAETEAVFRRKVAPGVFVEKYMLVPGNETGDGVNAERQFAVVEDKLQ